MPTSSTPGSRQDYNPALERSRIVFLVPSLFSELKRRNVVRVALGYGAAGWALIEVASVLFPIFDVPKWVLQVIASAVIVGFPVALVLAWIFELTPEGIKRADDLPADRPTANASGRRIDFAIIGVLGLAVIVFAFDKFVMQGSQNPAAATNAARSVAVLPFANRSTNQEDAWFADGMHDELLTRLSRVGALKIISRTSVLRFRDTDLPAREIARQLGVGAIMEGGVQRAANTVRINVKLVDASNDTAIWADTYDRTLTTGNIFAIQTEITEQIARALELTLTDAEKRRVEAAPATDIEAYQYYLKARQLLPLRTVEAIEEGHAYAQRAVERDPQFAPALALLADSLHLLHEYSGLAIEQSLDPAVELLQRALALDPNLAEAYTVLGEIRRHQQDYVASEAAFEKAIQLAPSDAQAYNWYSLLKADQGRIEEELLLTQRAHQLNPLHPVIHHNLAWTYFELARDEEAVSEFAKLSTLHPDFALGFLNQSWFYGLHGEPLASLRALRQHERIEPDSFVAVYACRRLVDLDDTGNAESCFSRVLAAHPDDPRVLLERTYGHLAEGRIEAARRTLRAAHALEDPDWPSWIARGWTGWLASEAVNVGDFDLARELLMTGDSDGYRAEATGFETQGFHAPLAAAATLLEDGEASRAQRILKATLAQIAKGHRARGANAYGYADVAAHAMLGERGEALRKLQDAVQAGYLTDWRLLEHGPQFAAIRNDPVFSQALADLASKARKQREQGARENLLDPVPAPGDRRSSGL